MTQEEIVIKLTEFENRLGVIENTVMKMDKMQEQINSLVVSVSNLTNGIKNLTQTTIEIKDDVKKIQTKEVDTYKSIKLYVVTTIIGLILGALATKLIIM